MPRTPYSAATHFGSAPPSPDYIPGPEAPPLPDYIPGPEYPEYLPPADDMLPAKEQPLPAAVSPTTESPGYITESEPEMEPEEDDGDDENSEGDSIEYPTSRGDDDADDDVMSSNSHATISYTSMSSYEVIVNGYYGMPMDPLDPYVQLIMGAPPSPDYILGPEAPSSPDYIPGLEYPEYLPPADDVLPAKEQPLPAAISPTAEGDHDANDDGDELSDDDADDEDEEESSDREEEEEEHLAPTVSAPALHSSILAFEDFDETEPFEEGETVATPPPFGYRVTARISVQPHIFMPFRSKSEVERLLAIPTPPLSSVSPTSYPLPPFLMPLPIFTPLPTSSFPLPLSMPSTSGSESIPEVNIPLRKRARFTTPTSRYEIGESFVAAVAARKIRPTLTIADKRRADDKLIGRLRRERRYFRTLATTYAQEIMDYCQSRKVHTRTLVTQIEALQRDEAINNLIAQRVADALAKYEIQRNSVINGDTSNTTGTGPKTVHPTRECTYKDYLNCGPLKFNGTEGIIGLT
nr:hypothetical protein [Tanacetum cinerariifolium]